MPKRRGCRRLRPLSHVSRRNSPRHGRIHRPPPSRRHPTSSSRPSRSRRRVRIDVASADNRGIPSTNAPSSRRKPSTARRLTIASVFVLVAGMTCSPCQQSCLESSSRSISRTCRWRSRSIVVISAGVPTVGRRSRRRCRLEAARSTVLRCATSDVPERPHCRNLAKRFETHGESYLRFITTPGVEPTNNLAEQAIRFVVIDRQITQGTRSETGNRWCERIWTVIATCTQQGRSVFAYLEAAVGAWFAGTEPAMLLPGG